MAYTLVLLPALFILGCLAASTVTGVVLCGLAVKMKSRLGALLLVWLGAGALVLPFWLFHLLGSSTDVPVPGFFRIAIVCSGLGLLAALIRLVIALCTPAPSKSEPPRLPGTGTPT